MGFDRGRRPFDRNALDHIGIERPLHEKIDRADLLRLLFKHRNESAPDHLALAFGILHAFERAQKALAGVDHPQAAFEPLLENGLDALFLALAQEPVIDEDAAELAADRLVDER